VKYLARATILLGFGLGLLACGGDSSPSAPAALRLVVAGRLERGATVSVAAWEGTDSISADRLHLTFQPPEAALALADNRIQLRRQGSVRITAALPDGKSITEEWTVATPPSVALELVVDGNRDIYRVAIDGGDLVRLTTDPGEDAQPTVGASTIAFSSFRNGQADLYALPVAGGAERRLTTTTDAETDPALSSDGKRLAFVKQVRGVGRVFVADSGVTGTPVRLTVDAQVSAAAPESAPSWSRDGRIAFISTASGQADVAISATDALPTTASAFAGSSPAADVEPSWSADGARLAFISVRDGPPALYIADARGTPVTRITTAGAEISQPTWLSDGRLVVIARRAAGPVLAWIDPATPPELHDIPLPGRNPAHPSALR
jgi:Tol biopolymer transport system component